MSCYCYLIVIIAIVIIDLPIVADLLQRQDDPVPPASGREGSMSTIQRGRARSLQQSRSTAKTQLAYSCHPFVWTVPQFPGPRRPVRGRNTADSGPHEALIELISSNRRRPWTTQWPRSSRGPSEQGPRQGQKSDLYGPAEELEHAQGCRNPAQLSRNPSRSYLGVYREDIRW